MDVATYIADRCDVGDCWEFSGYTNPGGYGQVTYKRKRWLFHRLVWTLLVGPIPEGHHIDHLCKNKKCCNPDHLEPVTQQENNSRQRYPKRYQETCVRGHDLSKSRITDKGHRVCRPCERERVRKYRLRKKNANG